MSDQAHFLSSFRSDQKDEKEVLSAVSSDPSDISTENVRRGTGKRINVVVSDLDGFNCQRLYYFTASRSFNGVLPKKGKN